MNSNYDLAAAGALTSFQNSKPITMPKKTSKSVSRPKKASAKKQTTMPGRKVTSRYIGVSYHANRGKWQVKIRSNGKQKHLGYFENEDDAARAYNRAAKAVHSNPKINQVPDDNSEESVRQNHSLDARIQDIAKQMKKSDSKDSRQSRSRKPRNNVQSTFAAYQVNPANPTNDNISTSMQNNYRLQQQQSTHHRQQQQQQQQQQQPFRYLIEDPRYSSSSSTAHHHHHHHQQQQQQQQYRHPPPHHSSTSISSRHPHQHQSAAPSAQYSGYGIHGQRLQQRPLTQASLRQQQQALTAAGAAAAASSSSSFMRQRGGGPVGPTERHGGRRMQDQKYPPRKRKTWSKPFTPPLHVGEEDEDAIVNYEGDDGPPRLRQPPLPQNRKPPVQLRMQKLTKEVDTPTLFAGGGGGGGPYSPRQQYQQRRRDDGRSTTAIAHGLYAAAAAAAAAGNSSSSSSSSSISSAAASGGGGGAPSGRIASSGTAPSKKGQGGGEEQRGSKKHKPTLRQHRAAGIASNLKVDIGLSLLANVAKQTIRQPDAMLKLTPVGETAGISSNKPGFYMESPRMGSNGTPRQKEGPGELFPTISPAFNTYCN